ncbi:nucleotidyltransferase family protein [Gammaproteobacteria bacterium LSUCC0112]|nr:nucleotidyltransferase family protein [Gammaproteobacteria bacterium LSUCC0112]
MTTLKNSREPAAPPSTPASKKGAILLAAGFSVRFGGIKLKAQLPNGCTLLQQTFINILQFTENIIIIGRKELLDAGVYDFLPATHQPFLYLCEDARSGMGHSLVCGIQHVPEDWQSAFVCLGDMPFVSTDTLCLLFNASNSQNIIIPTWQSARGHPVGFGRQFFPELLQCRGDSGARHILQAHKQAIIEMETGDSGVVQDIDTPEALRECVS